MTGQIQKRFGDDEENDFTAGFKIPETKSVLDDANKFIREQHQEDMKELEEAEKKGQAKRQKPKPGVICFCLEPSCRIGGFIERNS